MEAVFYEMMEIASNYYCLAALTLLVHCIYEENIVWNHRKKIMLLTWTIVTEVFEMAVKENLLCGNISLIGYFVIFMYGSKGKWLRGLMLLITVVFRNILSICLLCEIAFYYLLPGYQLTGTEIKNTELFLMNVCATVIYSSVYYYLSKNFLKRDIFVPFRKREKCLVAFYTIYLFVIYGMLILSVEDAGEATKSAVQTVLGLAVVVLGLLFPVFLFKNRVSGYYKERKEYQEEFLQAELLHFQQYKEAQEETKCFRHDIWNHLNCLNMLLQENKSLEAKRYLESLLQQVQNLSSNIVTGDEMLDCIVSAKLNQMKQENIVFLMDGVIDGGLKWNTADICCVFANALDNAIEACRKLSKEQERSILMTIKRTQQFYSIDISNTIDKYIDCERLFHRQAFYTTKENSKLHGFGLSNMRRTVERYGGMMHLSCTDLMFTVSIVIGRGGII